jgi:transposase
VLLVTTSTNHLPVPPRSPTEVTSKAKRRRFTAEYKRKVLQDADACTESGQIGALLRREGLYSSHLVTWRHARERGELEGLAPKKRGPKAQEPNPLARELAAKEREIARLKAENAKLQIICDVQKKVSLLLGITLPTIPEDDESTKGSL